MPMARNQSRSSSKSSSDTRDRSASAKLVPGHSSNCPSLSKKTSGDCADVGGDVRVGQVLLAEIAGVGPRGPGLLGVQDDAGALRQLVGVAEQDTHVGRHRLAAEAVGRERGSRLLAHAGSSMYGSQ